MAKRLIQVGDQVLGVLDAAGDADHVVGDPDRQTLLGREVV